MPQKVEYTKADYFNSQQGTNCAQRIPRNTTICKSVKQESSIKKHTEYIHMHRRWESGVRRAVYPPPKKKNSGKIIYRVIIL